ncbi:MAG: outer membrane beta-barrel protein [bacterium]
MKVMRCSIFIFLSCILLFQFSYAGYIHSWGVKVGINFTYREFVPVDMKVLDRQVKNAGFNFSAYLEWFNNRKVNILTELYYMKLKPYEFYESIDANGTSYEYERWELKSFDYISIPVMLKVGYPIWLLKPYITIGPRVDLFISSDCYNIGGKIENPRREFGWFLFGIDMGYGIDIRLTERYILSPEYRFVYDLTYSRGTYHFEGKKRVHVIMLGFGF